MKWPRPQLGLPLLGKELSEMAARRRTYIVRALYAVFIFLGFALYYHSLLSRTATYSHYRQMFGSGKQMFELLVLLQFAGIYVFVPTLMSAAITCEKERNALALLLITDLRPWEIILQKFIGRLIPMFTFLALSLPVMAIAYAFGGITTDDITSAAYLLLLACLQAGAVAIMASSYLRTTMKAFLVSYGIFGALYLGPVVVFVFLNAFGIIRLRPGYDRVMLALFPPYLFGNVMAGKKFADVVALGIPLIGSIIIFLVLARVFLVRGALASPASRRRTFRRVKKFFKRLDRMTGGFLLKKRRAKLPWKEPVAWREVTKKSQGRPHYAIQVAAFTAAVIFCIVAIPAALPSYAPHEVISPMVLILWIIAMLTITVKAADVIVSERRSQTLNILLTTPLQGKEIIREKMQGVRRIIIMFMFPLVALILTGTAQRAGPYGYSYDFFTNVALMSQSAYLGLSMLAVFIYPPMFAWVALWVSLKVRRPSRAIIITLVALFAWSSIPFAVLGVVAVLTHSGIYDTGVSFLMLLSPLTIIGATEWADFRFIGGSAGDALLLNFFWHTGVFLFFRRLCLKNADRYLGRA